jgi:hypothetical protein
VKLPEALLRQPAAQFVGEVQQEGHVKVALRCRGFRSRKNGKAFAVRMQVENPNEIRQ